MRENMIPEGWRKTTLSEVVDNMYSGGTPSTKREDFYNGSIPWIRTQEVIFNYITETDVKITELGLENSSARYIPINTVIVAMYGNSAGRVALSKIEATTNQACCNIVTNPDLCNPYYLFFNLMSRYREIESKANGAAQQNLNVGIIRGLDILLPPIEEQRAIAKVLSSLDDKITLLQKQNETLETLAQTLYQKEFGQYKVGDELPDGWRVGELGDISKHIKISLTPNITDQYYFHYSLPSFDNEQEPYFESGNSIKSSKYKVQDNCFLVSKLNPFTPRIWTVFSVDKNAICSTEFQVVQPDEVLYFGMIHCFLNSDLYTKKISEKIKGTSSSHQRVNPKDIFESEIVIPSTETLVSFNEIVMKFLLKKEKNKIQMKTLKETRDSLLTKLMSGEIRVKM